MGKLVERINQPDSLLKQRIIDVGEQSGRDQYTGEHSEAAHFYAKLQEPFRAFGIGEQSENAEAIERRDGQQVETTEQQVQREKDAEDGGRASRYSGGAWFNNGVAVDGTGQENTGGESDWHQD